MSQYTFTHSPMGPYFDPSEHIMADLLSTVEGLGLKYTYGSSMSELWFLLAKHDLSIQVKRQNLECVHESPTYVDLWVLLETSRYNKTDARDVTDVSFVFEGMTGYGSVERCVYPEASVLPLGTADTGLADVSLFDISEDIQRVDGDRLLQAIDDNPKWAAHMRAVGGDFLDYDAGYAYSENCKDDIRGIRGIKN